MNTNQYEYEADRSQTSYTNNDSSSYVTNEMAAMYRSPDITEPEKIDMLDAIIADRDPVFTREMYNFWADSYNEDMETLQYQGPKLLGDYINNTLEISTDATFLDVGCGTGLCGVTLNRQFGYKTIDGIDLSEKMMQFASRTGCYKETFLTKVNPTSALELRDIYYDCVFLCTSLLPGHITPESLPNLCRLVKPNTGYLIWLGPQIADMAAKSSEFDEGNVTSVLEVCANQCGMTLESRKLVEDFHNSLPGELFVLRSTQ